MPDERGGGPRVVEFEIAARMDRQIVGRRRGQGKLSVLVEDDELAVREKAGLFDCTHMGVLEVSGPEALGFLQTVTTNDASTLTTGKAQYSYILHADGGVLDDIIVYRRADELYLLLINAGNGNLMANDVIDYIIKSGGVTATVEGRIKTVN